MPGWSRRPKKEVAYADFLVDLLEAELITFTDWGEVFGDPVIATAILDRLLHHSHVINIRGESYRLREKRRSGLLQNMVQPEK